ncbi:hypothetical protein [Actinoplanes teichomyceticus]|uniref:Uncharacterized protein n=1 Tax=Actinoplanes teichomyceticus TaxID=1867 RepID=A0A561WA07_ACTTI|nr:hypothetical protein [Actinoplanes teichomyceticus]TWG20698.1 hypothetical protein FHX34_103227 [Actinoplanes teichomyceticus]GIF14354.1 hypothetical protein Ate01nite_43860 [Actinoplanes teichomyceticus]
MTDDPRPADADARRDRSERFGVLPPRIHPDDMVELAETRRTPEIPDSAPNETERALRNSAG